LRATVLLCALASILAPPAAASAQQIASGVVYHDRNRNGSQDRFEFGIRGVAVSNGRQVVTTDWRGRYRIPIETDSFVFVIKPGGWQTPLDVDRLPRFYYHHKPTGSPAELAFPGVAPTGALPEHIDFPLHKAREPSRFAAIVFGDPQPYSLEQLAWFNRDVIEELIGTDALFGISLGDLVGDDLTLFEPLNSAIAKIGIPWHNVLGNHDINFRARSDDDSDDSFERVFGPSNYAFEYGRVHFIVLDNVVYAGANTESGQAGRYEGGLDPGQLSFVANYLDTVPADRLVVLAMHIPFDSPPFQVERREQLLRILQRRRHTLSLVAHTHFQENQFFGPDRGFDAQPPHHQLIVGTTSGSWWLGGLDETGIPHATMRCGAPNGYSILSFDGNRYSVRFKAARRPADYQMNIFAPDSVTAAEAGETDVMANVFAGSEYSRVELRLDESASHGGEADEEHEDWIPMSRVPQPDPAYVEAVERDRLRNPRPHFFLPPPMPSPHLWVGRLPAHPIPGTHSIIVRSEDMYGQIFIARRLIRID
jgi:hypothetical protein